VEKLVEFNPLQSIALPNVGKVQPRGLVVIIGPNSSGKTQTLRDIQARLLGQPRKLVVCEEVELHRPPDLDPLLDLLLDWRLIRKRTDQNNTLYIDSLMPHLGAGPGNWSLQENEVKNYFRQGTTVGPDGQKTDRFLEHFGRSFLSSLFLDRRLTITNGVENFDYENQFPQNEMQALYVDSQAKKRMAEEAARVFGKGLWLDSTRANRLCLRISDDGKIPPAEDRLEPERMRKYRFIEDEGDGFRSYMGTCITLMLGQRPICLVDEPELCLHPPQAYALGRFIGKYGTSTERATFVATHSSHVLRGIIEETKKLEIIRLTRTGSQFSGKKVSQDTILACIEKPATKVETILDGLFAEAVTVVESEADRLVYSTTWEKLSHDFKPDVHFVSVGGLGGMADTCQLYKNLKIPVCLVADLDLLRELGTFHSILTALASSEQTGEAVEKCKSIIEQIKALGPLHSELELAAKLKEILGETLKWSDAEQLKRIRRTLSDLSAGLSETARLKLGLESLSDKAVYHDLKAYLGTLRSLGVFLVPVGELEDWVPHLMHGAPSKKNKPERANFMANRIRENPAGTDDVWAFIQKMAEYQRDEISRIGGYAL
jgi:hypothetical protein